MGLESVNFMPRIWASGRIRENLIDLLKRGKNLKFLEVIQQQGDKKRGESKRTEEAAKPQESRVPCGAAWPVKTWRLGG